MALPAFMQNIFAMLQNPAQKAQAAQTLAQNMQAPDAQAFGLGEGALPFTTMGAEEPSIGSLLSAPTGQLTTQDPLTGRPLTTPLPQAPLTLEQKLQALAESGLGKQSEPKSAAPAPAPRGPSFSRAGGAPAKVTVPTPKPVKPSGQALKAYLAQGRY